MDAQQTASHRLAATISKTPLWARHDLAASDDQVRERAADTIAAIVLNTLAQPIPAAINNAQKMILIR